MLSPFHNGGFTTVEAKHQMLSTRKEEVRALGARVDKLVSDASAQSARGTGCSASFWAWLGRRFGRQGRGELVATVETAAGAAAAGSASNFELNKAVFGLAGVKGADPAKKLEQAAGVMRTRIQQLEDRAAEHRRAARELAKNGQKQQALRMLRKAKAVDAQLESNQSSLMAIDQQVDMLAQAAIHKTLTSALASTSKTMKADSKMLSRAERAVDEAQDARDVAQDLNQVVADFAANGGGTEDDDELMEELEQMAREEPPPPPAAMLPAVAEEQDEAETARATEAVAQAMAALEAKHAAYDAAAAMPSVPTSNKVVKREEKAGLLASR